MAKDTHNQSVGFIDRAIERTGTYQDIASNAAALGDSATAARFNGRADAEAVRAEKAINNAISKLAK